MVVDVKIKLNEKLYLRDPQTTSLGEQILQRGLEMISKIGYEEFTFKKLAEGKSVRLAMSGSSYALDMAKPKIQVTCAKFKAFWK